MLLCVTVLLTAGILLTAIHPAIRAAGTMPSYGTAGMKVIDISQYNDSIGTNSDNIDFDALNTQVDAVYIRAFGNKGTGYYIDEQAANYAASCQISGLKFSFYDYYIPTADTADAVAEARAYYNFIKNFGFSCVPALDVEDNRNELSKEQLAASVKAFQDEFKALSGFYLMIYSYPYFMSENFDTSFDWDQYKLWIAHYGVSAPMEGISSSWFPTSLWCWSYWDMWQYTSTGTLSSIPNSSGGALDISLATDNILLAAPTSAQIVSVDIPEGISAGSVFTAEITVKNTNKIAWTASTDIRLGITGTVKGGSRALLPLGVSVAPDTTYTFTYRGTAPASGDLSMTVQMLKEGVCWFGDTKNVTILENDAQIVSITAPDALLVGQTRYITAEVKNTGLSVWTSADKFRLATSDARGTIPSGTEIAPGESYTFKISETAAASVGTKSLKIQMVEEGVAFFGEQQTLEIPVRKPSAAEISAIVLPDNITAGASYTAQITVKNTDIVTWTSSDSIRLGVTAPSSMRLSLPSGKEVAPGESYTFTYKGTAPSAGDLTLTVQMLKEGVCWFGSRQTLTVKQQDAQIISVTAPQALLIGQTQNLTVTMKNTGLTPWKADDKFRLATSDARGIMPAGTVIAPGGTYTFTVKETAPLTTGTKNLKLQMVIEGKAYFGEKQYLSIPVKKPAASEITESAIPATLIAGTKYTVSVTIKNTDNVTWNSTANLKLGLKLDGKDAGRVVSLPAGTEIRPGESYVFTGSFTPSAAGTYTFQLLQEGVAWFGGSISATASVT